MANNKKILGVIACLIASVSWGAVFPLSDHVLKYIDSFYFSTIRFGAIAIILVIFLLIKEGKKAFCLEGRGKELFLLGVLGFTVYNLLVFPGQTLMGNSGVIVPAIMEALMPMILISILWGYKHIRPENHTLLNMIIAFIGAVFVITKGDINFLLALKDNIFPVICVFVGVVSWVVYTMGGQAFSHWSALRYSTITCLFGTVVVSLITVASSLLGYLSVPDMGAISIVKYDLILLVVFPGVGSLVCWNYGVKTLSTINGMLFINIVPITTLIIMAIQGYNIDLFDMIGTLFIIVALIKNNMNDRRKKKKKLKVSHKRYLSRIS